MAAEQRKWVDASDWATKNFKCDYREPDGERCGKPVAFLLWEAGVELPDRGMCAEHRHAMRALALDEVERG